MIIDIATWILNASQVLRNVSSSPHLDAELIMSLATQKSREKLLVDGNKRLSTMQLARANYYLHLRKHLIPIAYITHHKKFYGLNFYVNKHVLIPRPETENLVQMALDHAKTLKQPPVILDLGCGSGCIGLSLKHALADTNASFILADISSQALKIAKKNAKRFKLNDVKFVKSNLLKKIDLSEIDILCANLPYVDRAWDFITANTKHEPKLALFARKNGLELIEKTLKQISTRPHKKHLAVFLEADPLQMEDIEKMVLKLFRGAKIKVSGFTMQILL